MIKSLAVLGCGNMARALVVPMAAGFPQMTFYTYTPSFTRAGKLADDIGGQAIKDLELLPFVDACLIGCKPQQVEELAENLAPMLKPNTLIISMLAGTNMNSLGKLFNSERLVRLMPNTPSQIGAGANLLYARGLGGSELDVVKGLFASSGLIYLTRDEEQIDRITPFTGSGPAYLFEFARILTDLLEKEGVFADDARKLVAQTLYGSASLLLQSEEIPLDLREKVTSKKGVTFEALKVMEQKGFASIMDEAIKAAHKRTEELAKGQG